ncbi:hypothetical protein AX15_007800 [Amanita polypyramis BW_CC]|nr:hypothetical protein AX15_007800 [Amanita polypyramis BW_CC]
MANRSEVSSPTGTPIRWPSESAVSIPPSSTAPSSPGPADAMNEAIDTEDEKDHVSPSHNNQIEEGKEEERMFEDEETERRYKRLEFVLEKSAVYSSILKARMEEDRARQQQAREARAKVQAKVQAQAARSKRTKQDNMSAAGKKRCRSSEAIGDSEGEEQEGWGRKRVKGEFGDAVLPPPEQREDGEDDEPPIFDQPTLLTGGKLKSHQLEGLQWMVSLDQNGISGILADEMGLGKTLQVIAFSAYLREHHNHKPFLIVCPLSVLHNWIDEYHKFAPKIPVCMYHGTPAERAELRRTVMVIPGTNAKTTPKSSKNAKSKSKSKSSSKLTAQSKSKSRSKLKPAKSNPKVIVVDTDDEQHEGKEGGEGEEEGEERSLRTFPVVVTTYEMIIKDRAVLAPYEWGYIVVDEGHRLKNLDCRLMTEIKKYKSAGRMILTGTPLHNNLSELWALLNFILPDIFDDLDAFQEWFNLPMLTNLLGSRSTKLITSLHAILKPFLLRRMKGDVEMRLPPKKEYVIYAPLTVRQREAYECVLEGRMREWLIGGGVGNGNGVMAKQKESEKVHDRKEEDEISEDVGENRNEKRRLRSEKRGRKKYADVDGDDDKYFEMLEKGEVDERGAVKSSVPSVKELGTEYQYKSTLKQVNNMRLQNTVMQLRKVCSHPFLFDWPIDTKTREPVLGRELVHASGKMMVLDRLLKELFKRGHKVLLFSQFTTMLDIIEAWATDYMGWDVCRIDGSTSPQERRAEMGRFQGKDGPRLFLLSTRAGGLGINLTAADTVMFYDQDWVGVLDSMRGRLWIDGIP